MTAKTPNPPSLDARDAFLHVINDYRWLATSACIWNLVGPNADARLKQEADTLLPNVDVAALDSVLVHARALIDFYTKQKDRSTDILLLENFKFAIDPEIASNLLAFKKSIEVHDLHITNWRDVSYRLANSKDASTDRRDWNRETSELVTLLYSALKFVSEQTGGWQIPFNELYKASWSRYLDKSFVWPKHLGESVDVRFYLDSLNL